MAPIAGLIAAALTVPTLLLFYFLKLRRRQVRVSSTLLWTRAVQDLQVNTPFRWLRVSLLLILQLLALVMLLIAVARPAIVDDGPGGSRVVIVIDRSASMSAGDGVRAAGEAAGEKVTRLDEAKRRGEELVTGLARRGGGWGFGSGGSLWQACVVAFAGRAEALTGFTSDAGALREAIRGVKPTDQPGDLAGLLRFVDALSGATGDESAPGERTRVYVVSDGSFGVAKDAPLPRPRGVDLELVRAGPAPAAEGEVESHDNLGIVSVSARRDYEDPGVVRVFVRVLNAGAGSVESMVQLRLDGELVDARAMTVPGVNAEGMNGEASVTFEMQNTVGGVAVVTLGRGDLLMADDAAAMVLSPSGRARVLVVAPGENGKEEDTYLGSVLEAMELRDLRTVGKEAYEEMVRRAQRPGGAPLGDSSVPDARDWDLVVFDRVRPEGMPTHPSISFGAGLPIAGLAVGPVDGAQGAERIVSWQRTHPVLRYVNLDQVLVAPPVALTLPSEAAGGKAEAIAWGEHGGLIGVLEDGAVRRVVVAFDIGRSNWGPDFSFPVFLSNAVEYLTMRGEASAGRFVRTTEPVQVRAAVGAKEVVLEGPVNLSAPVRAEGVGGAVSFGQVERVGVYRLIGAAPGPDRVAVNLCDVTETMVRTSNELPVAGMSRMMERGEGEGLREIWHWFVAAGLLLLVLEWFVQAWKMRT